MAVDKITWDRVGRVTEPGRYMYTFGWLTITAGDLEIWKQYPGAAFTLLTHVSSEDASPEDPSSRGSASAEYHLGAFDISPDAQYDFHGTTTHFGADGQHAH